MNKEKSDRIRTKPSKFGWRIHNGSQKVQITEMGTMLQVLGLPQPAEMDGKSLMD